MTEPEDALVRRAVSGERTALDALLKTHAHAVRNWLAGRIPARWQSVLSVDDVLQQTFVDALLDIGRFVPRGRDSFARWLGILAKRNLLDALKMLAADKRGGTTQLVDLPMGGDSSQALSRWLADTKGTPSRLIARDEARSAIEHAISNLPPAYSRLLRMYDLQGMRIEDVAAAFDRSPGAVYMMRARAFRRLRMMLGSGSKYISG